MYKVSFVNIFALSDARVLSSFEELCITPECSTLVWGAYVNYIKLMSRDDVELFRYRIYMKFHILYSTARCMAINK